MFKKDFIKRAKDIFSLKGIGSLLGNSDPSKIGIAPYRDWRMVGIGFFTIFLVSLGFNIYILFEVNRDNLFVVSQSINHEVSFNREGLNRVLGLFATREASFERLKKETVDARDPSL